MTVKYLYGTVPCGREMTFSIPGLGGGPPVHIINYGNLGMVTSDNPPPIYSGLSQQDLILYLAQHQTVIEEITRYFPVLPMRFGTIVGQEEVRPLLEKSHALLEEALHKMEGKMEMQVAVTWDLARLLQEVELEPVGLLAQTLRGRLNAEAVEEETELKHSPKESLKRRRQACEEEILSCLQRCAHDVERNPLLSDNLVANVALLVDNGERPALEKLVADLEQRFHGQLTFHLIGPMPPYSFATVEVRRVDPEELSQALRYLGLKDVPSPLEVTRIFRHLAHHSHRDLEPADQEAQHHLHQLCQAYGLVLDYACAPKVPDSGGFLVAIRRSSHRASFAYH